MKGSKRIVRKLSVLVAVTVTLGITFVSCSGGSKSARQTAGTKTATAAAANLAVPTADVPASAALTDQTINIGYGTTIDSLTPFRSNTARNAPFFAQLYEILGFMDADKKFEPYVAKSWTTDDNGFTYQIEIWDNVTDSAGNKITASDLVWFIQESKKRALKPVYAKVDSVKQTGDYTFSIKFKSNRVGTFETLLSDTYVISEKAFKASPDGFGTKIVSTSPYVCTEFVAGSSLKFERRADYWQDISKLPECVRPLAKTVTYQIIPEEFQMIVALETGKIDAALDVAPTSGAQFINKKGFIVDLSDGPQGWQVFFSGADSSIVANNVALRQAICYGIDANGLITAMCSGYGTQMWDVASPRLLGFDENWKTQDYYNYNLDKAKELLKKSGYNGQKITILSTSSAFSSRLAQLLQNYLTALGLNVEIKSMDMALYTAIRLDGTKYDLIINTIGGTSLADYWSIRFDPAAYATGDATGRKDEVLAQLVYKASTKSGWTSDNIDAVHNYIKDNAIGYGLLNPQVFTIWSDKLNMKKVVKGGMSGYTMFPSCQFKK